jgi:hypothetical protein
MVSGYVVGWLVETSVWMERSEKEKRNVENDALTAVGTWGVGGL